MSEKSDRRFFNHFAVIIILLHGIMIGLFVLARVVATATQEQYIRVDHQARTAIDERIQPFARVAVAGADNTALDIEDSADAAGVHAVLELSGEETYDTACKVCHAAGVSGAPRLGIAADWRSRLVQGKEILYKHAIEGYQGQRGVMPPKGGRTDLSDASVMKAVDYMASEAG